MAREQLRTNCGTLMRILFIKSRSLGFLYLLFVWNAKHEFCRNDMNENYFAQLSLVSAPRPNVVEGRQLLLDVFIYIGCTDNAQKWWQVIASRRTVFATAGTDVRICAWLAAFCQLQLSHRLGPGVPCAFRQAPSAQEQGLVRQAQVTQRVDSGGPWGCGAGNRKPRFASSFSVCVLTWQGKNQHSFNACSNFFPAGTGGNHEKVGQVNRIPSGMRAHKWTKVPTNSPAPPKWILTPSSGPTSPKTFCLPLTGFSLSSISLRFQTKEMGAFSPFCCILHILIVSFSWFSRY